MPVIIRRPRASADMSEIWEFIAEESIARADEFVDRADEKFRALAAQPLMGGLAMSYRQAFAVSRWRHM